MLQPLKTLTERSDYELTLLQSSMLLMPSLQHKQVLMELSSRTMVADNTMAPKALWKR